MKKLTMLLVAAALGCGGNDGSGAQAVDDAGPEAGHSDECPLAEGSYAVNAFPRDSNAAECPSLPSVALSVGQDTGTECMELVPGNRCTRAARRTCEIGCDSTVSSTTFNVPTLSGTEILSANCGGKAVTCSYDVSLTLQH